ncbi:CU044_5270 family protein [Actinoallomurus iriomotensis]|uniref:CU044_5270 family protein n=1 Tax=Actinoallomurus iriomotensis TaxID=478107 RepID=A0A9W6W054_9ACTN|nr:hypothetical protein Airi02_044990 [Actinoallomurus iriomotensis]
MNEMEMLAQMGRRLDQEAPPALGRQRQRQRLLEAAGSPRRHRAIRIPRWSLPATAGLAAAAVATVIGVATVGTGSGSPARTPARLDSASVTLTHAAQVVSLRTAITPRPHQWIYTKTVEYGTGSDGHHRTDEEWSRFDSRAEAYFDGGRFIVHKKSGESGIDSPQGAYTVLSSLPTDPRALLDKLSSLSGRFDELPGDSGLDQNQLLYTHMVQLLRNAQITAPPRIQAAVYRAMATLPDVRIDRDVVDGVGRHVIGVHYGSRGGRRLLLDPKTYQVVGEETVWGGKPTAAEIEMAKTKHLNLNLPAGTVTSGLATEKVAVVDKPGQR